ncbi:flagellar type III secretion system pore protein FliP [Desulfobacterium sp. N47]|uniref:flagellar type III secretion system pore protein FliP n=1 Tax=Desulfobacterium sp. N47 TaxID=3115210 RepID=UPI003C8E37C1
MNKNISITALLKPKGKSIKIILFFLAVSAILLILAANSATAANIAFPSLRIGVEPGENPEQVSVLIQILFLLTVLSLAPAILIMMTPFTRLAIVFSFLRQALGTQQTPSNQIIAGLSLFITFFIMMPQWQEINNNALQPYLEKKISQETALKEAMIPIRKFMFRQTREKDLAIFVKMSKSEKPNSPEDISMTTLIPAFVISELKTAFIIGFVLFVPFLIIDMVVASVLLSMGMMMLPPILISLPFKLMLFVLVDGWNLIVGSMVKSFV